MKVLAPGKLLLTGAYAVLEGAPAVVAAVDRVAIASDEAAPANAVVPREVAVAFADEAAPAIDVSAQQEGGKKLGVGSSAAALVAALGVRFARRGAALDDAAVRRALFLEARDVHHRAQGGGSGVDVAASTYGGVLVYHQGEEPRAGALPPGIVLTAFFSGESARTSDLLGRVAALAARDAGAHRSCMAHLREAAEAGAEALAKADGLGFLAAAALTQQALAALGAAAAAPIVPAAFAALHRDAAREGAVFFPSGAGGGDVGLHLGLGPPSQAFLEEARARGMQALDLRIDAVGVRLLPSASTGAHHG